MPTLPTLTVSQAHFDRLVAAFPGTTAQEKQDAYLAWLTNSLITFVERVEGVAIQQEMSALWTQRINTLHASLPPRIAHPGLDPMPGPPA